MVKTGVDLSTYRSTIGLWSLAFGGGRILRGRRRGLGPTRQSRSFLFIILYLFLLLRASALPVDGDTERNPGPPPSSSISINLNSNLKVNGQRPNGRPPNGSQMPPRPHRHGAATDSAKQLQLLHFNARSLFPKRVELEDLVLRCLSPSPHLIAVMETWLNDTVPDAAVAVPGYSSVFRTDRLPGRRGGGVLILAKDGVK